MKTVRNVRIHAVLLVCLIASACVHNPSTPAAVTVPQTALQKTIVFNAALSEANLAVQRAVKDLQASGALTVAQARPVVTGTVKVAKIGNEIRDITSKGTEASWSVDGPKIRALLAETPLKLPTAANVTVDLLIETVNAAVTLLVGVK